MSERNWGDYDWKRITDAMDIYIANWGPLKDDDRVEVWYKFFASSDAKLLEQTFDDLVMNAKNDFRPKLAKIRHTYWKLKKQNDRFGNLPPKSDCSKCYNGLVFVPVGMDQGVMRIMDTPHDFISNWPGVSSYAWPCDCSLGAFTNRNLFRYEDSDVLRGNAKCFKQGQMMKLSEFIEAANKAMYERGVEASMFSGDTQPNPEDLKPVLPMADAVTEAVDTVKERLEDMNF